MIAKKTPERERERESESEETRGNPGQLGNEGVGSARGLEARPCRVDGMARGEGEPSAKRAKVEEDPLVRRKEEVVRLLEEASAKGKELVRKAEEEAERLKREAEDTLAPQLYRACADIEAANRAELLKKLPPELWEKIVDESVQQNDMIALAMTCRFFRDTTKDLGKKMETHLEPSHLLELRKSGKVVSQSLGWFQWVCGTMEILPTFEEWRIDLGNRPTTDMGGATHVGALLHYAAFQGSVEIVRWLMEEKGYELEWGPKRVEDLGMQAGLGGSIEVLEYLKGKGYEFDRATCRGAAWGGRLEALKFLRAQDPPCPWDEKTCEGAALGGHLEVLKWVRSQDPPCHWDEETCAWAARDGHLDILKWMRSQDPPCPWGQWTCSKAALGGHLDVLKWVRGQDPPCPWEEYTCVFPAVRGHLEVLKWLRSQDPPCPWNHATCFEAAGNGHLEVLKWARDQDPPCPADGECCRRAAKGGHLEVLKWLRDQDPPCPWSRSKCKDLALRKFHFHIVQWIDQQEDDESDVSDMDSDVESSSFSDE